MTQHYFICAFALLLNAANAICQPQPFQKSFGDTLVSEYGISVIQLAGGSVFFAGYNYNSSGTTDITLTKLDMNGNMLWQTAYHDSLRGLFSSKMIFHNSSFYIAGQSTDAVSNIDAIVLHLDTLGNLLFLKSYGSVSFNESFNWMEPDSVLGFMCNGFASAATGTGNDIYIARLDTSCDLIWANNYGSVYNDVSMTIRRTATGDFILSGDKLVFPTPSYNPYVLKVDTAGNQLWDVDVVNPFNSGCRSILVNSDGDYIVVGESATPTSSYFDVLLCKISASGSPGWIKTIPATDKGDAGFSIMEPVPGHYLITGYGYNAADSSTDVVLIHADSAGNEISKRYYDHSQLDFGYEISPSVFGGFLIAGTNYGTDNQYFLIYDTVSISTSVNNIPSANSFSFYPNLLEGNATIHFSRELHNVMISVADLEGRILFIEKINTPAKELKFGKIFSPGMYLVKIESAEITFAGKIIFR